MTKEEYLDQLQSDLLTTIVEERYSNHKNQVIARKLSAQFRPTFDESLLWSRALYISSNACVLLIENKNLKLAINSLKDAAEVYENLSLIAQNYDKEYAIILSSLCYDLAGYQANARCLIKQLTEYSFESIDEKEKIEPINYILHQVRRILSKNIMSARSNINVNYDFELGIKYFNQATSAWFENILNGTEGRHLEILHHSYKYYLNSGNVVISHLLFLLRARVIVYGQRAIWGNLSQNDFINNSALWKRYIKLLTNDIYDRDQIKPVEQRISKFEFWTSQLRAIQTGLLSSDYNFVIQMPTSAGKTFIAELAIVDSLIKHPNKKCIYISPFRALTNEKESELAEYISKLGFSVSSLSGSYEVDEFQNIILEETDILVATPEKIDLILRLNPDYFDNVSLLVIDEGHIVGDISARSSLMEFLVIRLRMKIPTVRILFISAVMPPENADEYSVWLNGQGNKVIRSLLHADSPVGEDWEPTRKLIGAFTWDGDNGRIGFKAIETEDEESKVKTGAFIPALIRAKQHGERFPDKTNKAQTSASIAYQLSSQGNCLVFCAQARETTRVGAAMLSLLQTIDENNSSTLLNYFIPNREKESYYFARKWFGENDTITKCLERGIGIHYGDLPEPVRRGVESDYNTGRLRVLISTNTVGQGLNLPIKYLVIHSTLIMPRQPLSVRDFWNIVGRAGRAGKETEGQIIFNIKSYTDRQAFERYTDKTNIEKAFSMFFNVLNWFVRQRISNEQFNGNLELLAEPYFLSLLVEESVETDIQAIVESIINASLFKVQAEARNISLEPLRNSFTRIFNGLKDQVPAEMINVFSETGLVLRSNKIISEYIAARLDLLNTIVQEDNYNQLLEEIFLLFDLKGIIEMASDKLDKLKLEPSQTIEIAKLWISGSDIDDLQGAWSTLSDEPSHLHILIADAFYYRYPWGIASFITILSAKLGRGRDSFGVGLKNLSTYMKFGLNNPTACLAKGLGIKNRDVALLLSNESNGLEGKNFIAWFANLTMEDVQDYEISRYDQLNILNVAIKLTPQRYADTPRSYSFYIRGIPFENQRKATSSTVQINDALVYQRDTINQFDPYAIKILKGDSELGFVPREFSKQISVELDVNASDYSIVVTNIETETDYNKIIVTMTKL
jgi:helicase